MILDKLFLSFTFLLIIGLLVTWFWMRSDTGSRFEATVSGIMTLLDIVWFVGFVVTGILGIWF